MRLSVPATVAALCASAQAFSDSSPFILFSTAKLSQEANPGQLQSSSQILSSTKDLLASCPTERYLIVSQPNLNAAHLSTKDAVPKLTQTLEKAASQYSVAEVAGELDLFQISTLIREACGKKTPSIDGVDLSPLSPLSSTASQKKTLKYNDEELGMTLEQYEAEGSYTVIYTGGPRTDTPKTYTADFQDSVHTELKRQLHKAVRDTDRDTRPLFEKYQFFTPGIFMGLIAFIVLMSILYAGIYAVASLDVSYGAFDKDMGPAAQKKQQ